MILTREKRQREEPGKREGGLTTLNVRSEKGEKKEG